jgi:hypothetical protein
LIGLICLGLYLYSRKHGSLPCRCCKPQYINDVHSADKKQLPDAYEQQKKYQMEEEQQKRQGQPRDAAFAAGAGAVGGAAAKGGWRDGRYGTNKEDSYEIHPSTGSDVDATRDVQGSRSYSQGYDQKAVDEPRYKEYDAVTAEEPMHGDRAAGSSRTATAAAVGAGAAAAAGGGWWRGRYGTYKEDQGEIRAATSSDNDATRDVQGSRSYSQSYDQKAVEEPVDTEYDAVPVEEPMYGERTGSSSRTAAAVGAGAAAAAGVTAAAATGKRDQGRFSSEDAAAADAPPWEASAAAYNRDEAAAAAAAADVPATEESAVAAAADGSRGGSTAAAAGGVAAGGIMGGLAARLRNWRASDSRPAAAAATTASDMDAGTGIDAGRDVQGSQKYSTSYDPNETDEKAYRDYDAAGMGEPVYGERTSGSGRTAAAVGAGAAAAAAAGVAAAAAAGKREHGSFSSRGAATDTVPWDTPAASEAGSLAREKDSAAAAAAEVPSGAPTGSRGGSATAAAAGGVAAGGKVGGLAARMRSWKSIDSRTAATDTVPWDTPTASEADAGAYQRQEEGEVSQHSSAALAAAAAAVGGVGGAAAAAAARRGGQEGASSSSSVTGHQKDQTVPASRLSRMTIVEATTDTVPWDTPPASEPGSFEPQHKGSSSTAAAAAAAAAGAATATAAAAKLRAEQRIGSFGSAGADVGTVPWDSPPDTPSAAEARAGTSQLRQNRLASIDSRDTASNVMPYGSTADSEADSSAALAAAAAAAAAAGGAVAAAKAKRSGSRSGAAAAGGSGGWGTWFSSWWADKKDDEDLPASRVVPDSELVKDQAGSPQEPWMDIGQLR